MDIFEKILTKNFNEIIDKKIIYHLQKDRLDYVLEELSKFPSSQPESFKADVNLLLSRYSAIENKNQEISFENYNIEINRIRYASINLIEEYRKDATLMQRIKLTYQYSPIKIIKSVSLLLSLIGLISTLGFYFIYYKNLQSRKIQLIENINSKISQINRNTEILSKDLEYFEKVKKTVANNLKAEELALVDSAISSIRFNIKESNYELNEHGTRLTDAIKNDELTKAYDIHSQIHSIPTNYQLKEKVLRLEKVSGKFDLLFLEFQNIEKSISEIREKMSRMCNGCPIMNFNSRLEEKKPYMLEIENDLISNLSNKNEIAQEKVNLLIQFNKEVISINPLNYRNYINIINKYKKSKQFDNNNLLTKFDKFEKIVLSKIDSTSPCIRAVLKSKIYSNFIQETEKLVLSNKDYDEILELKILVTFHKLILMTSDEDKFSGEIINDIIKSIPEEAEAFVKLEGANKAFWSHSKLDAFEEKYNCPFSRYLLEDELKLLLRIYTKHRYKTEAAKSQYSIW